MAVSAITSPAGAGGDDALGAGWVADLISVARMYATHPKMPQPTKNLNIPVPPGAPGARLAFLDDTAEKLGVDVTERDGMLIAELKVGEITLEAHLAHPDGSTSGYLTRRAACLDATGATA